MLKGKLLRPAAALPVLTVLCGTAAGVFAEEATGQYNTEEYGTERDGKRTFGGLYMPENTVFPLPLFILSRRQGGNQAILAPRAEALAGNGFAACVSDSAGGPEKSLRKTEQSGKTTA